MSYIKIAKGKRLYYFSNHEYFDVDNEAKLTETAEIILEGDKIIKCRPFSAKNLEELVDVFLREKTAKNPMYRDCVRSMPNYILGDGRAAGQNQPELSLGDWIN